MIDQSKTHPGGITVGIGVKINADFILADFFQQLGKHRMGGYMQTLPIGWIMPASFGFEVFGAPARQRSAQVLFGLCAARFAVKCFLTGFQSAAGLPVKRPDQRGFPVVPRIGANAADVTYGQNR